jgi:hypothetical protein
MKNRQIFSALFLLTTAFTANGVTLEVEFTENLTNETEWVYAPNTKISKEKGFHITSAESVAVASPTFDFAITSVTVVAHLTSENTRRTLYVIPMDGDQLMEDKAQEIAPLLPDATEVSRTWTKEYLVRKIGFRIEGESGNVYLLSAKIYGVSIPYPPENLETSRIGGKQITIKWQNPENVQSNNIRVYKSTWSEESFETVKSYDFNAEGFQNKGKNDEITADLLIESYPDFADSTLIYLPTNSVGQIQISKSDEKGVLKHKGFENYNSLCVDMTVRKYFTSKKTEENGGTVIKENEDDDTMTVGYEYPAGTTNVFATVNLEKDFKREIIPLNGVPADAPILFNATGNKTNHRVIIDEMKFIKNYSPAGERLDLVQETNTSGSKIRLSNLERNTDYVIRVAAADANGKESESAELRVKTSSQNDSGFYLKVR